jgi:hypothetical protein
MKPLIKLPFRRLQWDGYDWHVGFIHYKTYLVAQQAEFSFHTHRRSFPYEPVFDLIDLITPSGV